MEREEQNAAGIKHVVFVGEAVFMVKKQYTIQDIRRAKIAKVQDAIVLGAMNVTELAK